MAPNDPVMSAKQAQGVSRRTRPSSLPPPGTAKPRKAALLIGCKYKGNKHYPELTYPHMDVVKVKNLLMKQYNYEDTNIVVLLDDGKHVPPTKENIVNAMKNLVGGSKSGDCFFFHFSGHGEQTPCAEDDKTELDGLDEAIVPCDATNGKETWIIDNVMNELLVRKLHVNAQLIALFDMCHSGTALDLKHYCYNDCDAQGPDVAAHQHGAEPVYRRNSIHEGAIHIYRRTSHDIVENEIRRLNELPLGTAETSPNDGQDDAARGKNVRRFTYTGRKSSMHCEFPENSDADSFVKSAIDEQVGSARRMNTCADCGGSVDDYGTARGYEPEPDKPVPKKPERKKRITIVWDDGGRAPAEEHRVPTTRRHSEPSGCLSGLQSSWLCQFLKRHISKSGLVAAEKRKDNENPQGPPTRSSTTTSATALLGSSTIPPSSSGSVRPVPSFTDTNRYSAPPLAAPTLRPIRENGHHSQYSSEGEEIPRCTSPQDFPDLRSPTSQECFGFPPANGGSSEPSGTFKRMLPGKATQYQQHAHAQGQTPRPRRCKCRLSSGEKRKHGQVITISAANDEQLAWETQKGSLTSAIVEILEKDPRPTYASLRTSVQTVLNKMSDDMRRIIKHNERHTKFQELRPDRGKQRKQKQKEKKSLRRSASASRRNSRKSGDEMGQDWIDALQQTVDRANGGPVQIFSIGSENFMDLNKTRFGP